MTTGPRGFRRLLAGACLGAAAGCATVKDSVMQSAVRLGAVGELGFSADSPAVADLGAAVRLAVATLGASADLWADAGVRRTSLPQGGGTVTPYVVGGGIRWNFRGGYPGYQFGALAGYERYGGAVRGWGWQLGLAASRSLGRGHRTGIEVARDRRHVASQRFTMARVSFSTLVRTWRPWLSGGDAPPFDLIRGATDANGLPLDPRWRRPRSDGDRACQFWYVQSSEQPSLVYRRECSDDPITLNQLTRHQVKSGGFSCSQRDAEPHVRGHVNWFEVTQRGRIRWKSFVAAGDHDLTLWLEADSLVTAGTIRSNRSSRRRVGDPARMIEIEFNGDETVARFDSLVAGAPWQPLIRIAQGQPGADEDSADLLLFERPAVVTGILGLDAIHHFQTEIHPVFALAADVSHIDATDDHVWLVLLRNFGDEGECGFGLLPWRSDSAADGRNVYFLELPWVLGADSVAVLESSTFGRLYGHPATLDIQTDSGRAVRLAVGLPAPAKDSLAGIYGTLRLRWLAAGVPVPPRPAASRDSLRLGARRRPDAHGGGGGLPAPTGGVAADSLGGVKWKTSRVRRGEVRPARFLARPLDIIR